MTATATATATLLILGADGDLTKRLLLPGLGTLLAVYDLDLEVIGSGLQERSDAEWRALVAEAFGEVPEPRRARLVDSSRYVRADAADADDLSHLLAECAAVPVIYFALPPSVTARVCAELEGIPRPEGLRLALEKPFGTDLESARRLNELLTRIVPERQVYRIDHFLGRATVLNILGTRFANRLIEPIWNRNVIERVEIVYDETLALESRAGYYDHAGALVDMIQSHLLAVLALIAMEPVDRVDEVVLRDAIATVLRATAVWDDDPVTASRRARYSAGEIEGRALPAYADEDGVDPSRDTETYAEVTFRVSNWRWAGTPFRLRTGKAIGTERREIAVHFKSVPHEPFDDRDRPNVLRFQLSPDAISLQLNLNGEGDPFDLEQVGLDAEFPTQELPPYSLLLKEILEGDATLSIRGDEAEELWRIVEPVLSAWADNEVPLEEYRAGSAGPSGARVPEQAGADEKRGTAPGDDPNAG